MIHRKLPIPIFAVIGFLGVAAIACDNPISSARATRAALGQTAAAALWTPTSTSTKTPTSTNTATPTVTPTPDPRYHDGKGGFVFIPPAGWVPNPSDDYRYDRDWYFPTTAEDWQCKLSFSITTEDLETTQSRAEGMIAVIADAMPGFALKFKRPFSTSHFGDSYTYAYYIYIQGVKYQDTNYLFSKDQKMVTASALCEYGVDVLAVLDESMKTLAYE